MSWFRRLFRRKPKQTEFDPVAPPSQRMSELLRELRGRLERFLVTHTPPETAGAVFEALGGAASPPGRVVAFLVSELDAAFRLGLWLLAPFLVVDLLTAHALLALGFDRLRPAAVALPLKLALFVAADGWLLLVGRLAGGYGP